MINPIASEAINSATYVDNYIDSVENLPDDVQRQLTRIHDIDVQYRGLIRDVDHYYDLYLTLQNSADVQRRGRSIARMHQSLIQAQELGDEKMQIVNHLQEIIDSKLRQLDQDQTKLDIKDEMLPQREHLGLLDDSQIPLKQSRTQSPTRDQTNNGGIGVNGSNGLSGNVVGSAGGIAAHKDHFGSGAYASSISSSVGIGGGNSTPNSERSGNISNGANSGGNGGPTNGSSHNLGASGSELQRTGSNRSRRRKESLVHSSNIELGGNESNSANETGSNGGERNLGQKSGLGAAQKKGTTQAGLGGTNSGNNSGKKKKRKVRGGGAGGGSQSNSAINVREDTPPPEPIDPDEPTYCVCNQISFGEMILCDNDLCPIEWFHFSCVALVLKPKGKWFCPNCRGERPNVMKPKAQFLKELERYNKEKEEKT